MHVPSQFNAQDSALALALRRASFSSRFTRSRAAMPVVTAMPGRVDKQAAFCGGEGR